MRSNYYHILSPIADIDMPKDFIFFDTETKEEKIGKESRLTLKVGWLCHWRKGEDESYYEFKTVKEFWDLFFSLDFKDVWVYAHNTDFDIKIVDGFEELLLRRGFNIKSLYIEGKVFCVIFEKEDMTIRFYDTFNYVPMSLKKLGESVGIKKMEVDFNTASDEELSVYCRNDVKIIFNFIKTLVYYLEQHNLGPLRGTAAALSMCTFRHKFYDEIATPLCVHDFKDIIALERRAYKGGITDCFKVGRFEEDMIKLDVNSMYPHIMKSYQFPIKVKLKGTGLSVDALTEYLKKYHVIADVRIWLPKDKAYILTKFKTTTEKSGFLYGEFSETLCSPELEFVLKYGKILRVDKYAVYHKANIFSGFIDFFYNERMKYKGIKSGDTYVLLTKLFMNSLYGKFGQKASSYKMLTDKAAYGMEKYTVLWGDPDNTDIIKNYTVLHVGNYVWRLEQVDDNSFDAFVAVAAMVTSYARMYLIDLLMKCGRDNVFYVDTDCLIIKKGAYESIKDYIDDKKLGFLKNEGESDYGVFYRPKYYEFNRVKKCKGVKKLHETISDNNDFWEVKYDSFERFKTSLKNKSMDFQRITTVTKKIMKGYDKGFVAANGDVLPFELMDVMFYRRGEDKPVGLFEKVYPESDLLDAKSIEGDLKAEIMDDWRYR